MSQQVDKRQHESRKILEAVPRTKSSLVSEQKSSSELSIKTDGAEFGITFLGLDGIVLQRISGRLGPAILATYMATGPPLHIKIPVAKVWRNSPTD